MAEKKPWYIGESPLGAAYAHFANVAGLPAITHGSEAHD